LFSRPNLIVERIQRERIQREQVQIYRSDDTVRSRLFVVPHVAAQVELGKCSFESAGKRLKATQMRLKAVENGWKRLKASSTETKH
jgi:hypothetical protein